MTLLSVCVDMDKITKYLLEQIPEEIDKIVEPYHMKWCMWNQYIAEEGYDEDLCARNAKKALESTAWLKDAVFTGIWQEITHKKLEEINTEGMTAPKAAKLEYYRKYFEGKEMSAHRMTYPNPIVIDEHNRLLDGYISYLLMKERGLESAECFLVSEGTVLKKYVNGVHLLNKAGATSQKRYTWAYPLREPVVRGDILVADTSRGKKLIQVTSVDMATKGYVDSLKKVRKKAAPKDLKNHKYYGFHP